MGVDPMPFTLRELTWMAEGRRMEDWTHTAAIRADVRNLFRGEKDQPASPIDLHPYGSRIRQAQAQADDPASWSEYRKQYEAAMRDVTAKAMVRAAQKEQAKRCK